MSNTINNSIKQTFGNHNMVRQYLDYVRDTDMRLPLFRPVLYRAIACSGPDDIDTIMVNEKAHHEAKNRLVLRQLVEQYNGYVQLRG
jgi:hypothetical protein